MEEASPLPSSISPGPSSPMEISSSITTTNPAALDDEPPPPPPPPPPPAPEPEPIQQREAPASSPRANSSNFNLSSSSAQSLLQERKKLRLVSQDWVLHELLNVGKSFADDQQKFGMEVDGQVKTTQKDEDTQNNTPRAFIERFEREHSLARMPEARPGLQLSDVFGIPRGEVFRSTAQHLMTTLQSKLRTCDQFKLLALLEASILYFEVPELHPLPMHLLQTLAAPAVPRSVLEIILTHLSPEAFEKIPKEVKRRAWVEFPQHFTRFAKRLIEAYSRDPAINTQLDLVRDAALDTARRRKQTKALGLLLDAVGENQLLFASLQRVVRELFYATENATLCTLQADLVLGSTMPLLEAGRAAKGGDKKDAATLLDELDRKWPMPARRLTVYLDQLQRKFAMNKSPINDPDPARNPANDLADLRRRIANIFTTFTKLAEAHMGALRPRAETGFGAGNSLPAPAPSSTSMITTSRIQSASAASKKSGASSIRIKAATATQDDLKDMRSKARSIWNDLQDVPQYKQLFGKPVAEAWPELRESYQLLIKNPMDLRWVGRRIPYYTSVADFAADLELIAYNCETFNANNPPLVAVAQQFREAFEQRLSASFHDWWATRNADDSQTSIGFGTSGLGSGSKSFSGSGSASASAAAANSVSSPFSPVSPPSITGNGDINIQNNKEGNGSRSAGSIVSSSRTSSLDIASAAPRAVSEAMADAAMVVGDRSLRLGLVRVLADLLDLGVTREKRLAREDLDLITLAWVLRVGEQARAVAKAALGGKTPMLDEAGVVLDSVSKNKEEMNGTENADMLSYRRASNVFGFGFAPPQSSSSLYDVARTADVSPESLLVRLTNRAQTGRVEPVVSDVRQVLPSYAVLMLQLAKAATAKLASESSGLPSGANTVPIDDDMADLCKRNSLMSDLLVRLLCQSAKDGNEAQALLLLESKVGLQENPALRRSLATALRHDKSVPQLRRAALRDVYLPTILASAPGGENENHAVFVDTHRLFAWVLGADVALSSLVDGELRASADAQGPTGMEKAEVVELLRAALRTVSAETYGSSGFKAAAREYEKIFDHEWFASTREEFHLPVRPESRHGTATGPGTGMGSVLASYTTGPTSTWQTPGSALQAPGSGPTPVSVTVGVTTDPSSSVPHVTSPPPVGGLSSFSPG